MKYSLLAALVATLPSLAMAAVNLEVGRGMELIAVNGIPVDSPLFIGKVESQVLPDGNNQIAVRAGQLVKDGNNTKKFTSQVSILTFSATNQTVNIAAPALKTWERGVAFDKAPNWQLTQAGQAVSYQLGELTSMTNMAMLRNFGAELDAFNRSNQPAALPSLAGVMQGNIKNAYDLPTATSKVITTAVATTAVANPLTQTEPAAEPSGSAAQQARFWFDKMTPTEKRDFISWAAQNL